MLKRWVPGSHPENRRTAKAKAKSGPDGEDVETLEYLETLFERDPDFDKNVVEFVTRGEDAGAQIDHEPLVERRGESNAVESGKTDRRVTQKKKKKGKRRQQNNLKRVKHVPRSHR